MRLEKENMIFLSTDTFYPSCVANHLEIITSMLKDDRRERKFFRQTLLKHDGKGGDQEPNVFN